MNNKILLLVFGGCLLVFFGSKYLKKDHTASFDPVITQVDTSVVDRLEYSTGGQHAEEFKIVKEGNIWKVLKGTKSINIDDARVKELIAPLVNLQAQRVVTKNVDSYPAYEAGDDQATHLMVYEGDKKLADVWIGGFKFDQATRSASVYIRKSDLPDVYLIDGFAAISLRANFDRFRDKKLVSATAEDLTSLEWTDVGARKEVIVKEDGVWHYAGMEAVDSTAFATYLNSLVGVQGSEFSDHSSPDALTLVERLTLYGNNMIAPTVITAYRNPEPGKSWLLHSSDNPEAYFVSDSLGIYKRIFSDLTDFWP